MNHRGRHQAQGRDVAGGTCSHPWAQGAPYPATNGHADLTTLEVGLGAASRARRAACFQMAHRFVTQAEAAGGVGPVSKSFPAGRPGEDTDVRVDIEVSKGLAFI